VLRYTITRIALFAPVLGVVVVVVFAIVRMIPGDPAQVMLGEFADQGQVDALHHAMGLDRPLAVQLGIWVWQVVRGHLGTSIFFNQPVQRVILDHVAPTASIVLWAVVVAVALAVPTGIVSAVRRGTWIDSLTMATAFVGVAMPDFWSGLILALVFAVWLRWFPVSGFNPLSDGVGPWLRSVALPAAALGFVQVGLLARMLRDSLIDALQDEYVRTARAKGLAERRVLLRHALRNAVLPVLTVLGNNIAGLLSGVVIIETVFNIRGLGWMTVNAVLQRDYPLVQAAVLFPALLYSTANLAIDLAYSFVDPRIRYQ
jgi:peptide/nickel transport system permease protein